MPDLDARIDHFAVGDALTVRRTILRRKSKLAAGVTITAAWMTVKDALVDADPGRWQKVISTTDVPGTGQIEDDGAGDVNPIVRFDLLAADTRILDVERFFDIQVLTSAGGPYTAELGKIAGVPDVTLAVS
jgi:hypothetical protein